MNKKNILGIVIILAIVGLLIFVSNDSGAVTERQTATTNQEGEVMQNDNTEAMIKDDEHEGGSMMQADNAMMAMVASAGTYEEYSSEKVTNATTENVVIYFKASWCPSCRVADADIKANLDNIPDDLTILYVDYDTATELKKKYKVRMQHTFVQVDGEGNLIKLWTGSPTLEDIVSQVE